MSNFKDTAGRNWVFTCNVFTLARCKKETGIDLARSIEKGATVVDSITGDVSIFFDVLCSLLQEQMEKVGIDAQGLGEAINDEDVVIEATQALVRSVIDFFPKSRSKTLRTAFDRLWNLTAQKAEAEQDKAIATIEAMDWEQMANNIVGNSIHSSSESTSTGTDS